MKNHLIFILILFSFGITFSQNSVSSTGYNFNRTYEGIIEKKSNRGLYGLGGNKSLIRLHIYRYDYTNISYQDKYDRVSKQTVYPKTVIGLIEVYENKRGKGIPEKIYFTAISYESTNALEIENFSSVATNRYGDLKIIRQNLEKFSIPTSNLYSIDIDLPYYPTTKFKKVKSYESVPLFFDRYFEISLDKIKENSGNVVYLGYNGRGNSSKLIINNYSVRDQTLEASFIYNKVSKFGLKNPSMYWLDDVEHEIKNVLKNKNYGAHTKLQYLPNVNRIKVSISSNPYSIEPFNEKTYYFNVKIIKGHYGLDYDVSLSQNANDYITNAEKADLERQILAEKKYAEKLKEQKIQEEKKRLAAEEAKRELFAMLTEKTTTGEPTEKQMKFAISTNLGIKMGVLKSPANIELNNSSGPVEAIAKLMGMGFDGYEIEIKTFKKYNCKRVGNTSEFDCEYLIKMVMGGKYGSIIGSISNNLDPAEKRKSRFVKLNDIWMTSE